MNPTQSSASEALFSAHHSTRKISTRMELLVGAQRTTPYSHSTEWGSQLALRLPKTFVPIADP